MRPSLYHKLSSEARCQIALLWSLWASLPQEMGVSRARHLTCCILAAIYHYRRQSPMAGKVSEVCSSDPDMIVCVVRDSGCLAIFLVPRLISALSRSRLTYGLRLTTSSHLTSRVYPPAAQRAGVLFTTAGRPPPPTGCRGLLERTDVTLLPLPDKLRHWCN